MVRLDSHWLPASPVLKISFRQTSVSQYLLLFTGSAVLYVTAVCDPHYIEKILSSRSRNMNTNTVEAINSKNIDENHDTNQKIKITATLNEQKICRIC